MISRLLSRLGLLFAALLPGSAHAADPEAEAAARKARSIAILEAEGVPVLPSLPMIEAGAGSTRRKTDEVVRRMIALAIVAVKGETGDADLGDALVRQFGARRFLSPAERAFLDDRAPSEETRIQFAWRYEGVAVMLWALGFYEELGRPDAIADVPRLADLLRAEGTEGLLRKARLRPQSELLDAADLIYRYHWACVDARIKGAEAPAGLDAGVVYERHYTLNWLIGHLGQPWDDISTDT